MRLTKNQLDAAIEALSARIAGGGPSWEYGTDEGLPPDEAYHEAHRVLITELARREKRRK